MWNSEERVRVIEALTAMCELFGKELSPAGKALFIRVLESKITAQETLNAFSSFLASADSSSSFFPKPGDIIRIVEGHPDDLIEHAWHEVISAIERIGPWESVSFNPITNQVIQEMGGWVAISQTKSYEELNFKGHEFRKLFRLILQTKRPCKIKHLPGLIEVYNSAHGFDEFIPEPISLGNSLPKSIQKSLENSYMAGTIALNLKSFEP